MKRYVFFDIIENELVADYLTENDKKFLAKSKNQKLKNIKKGEYYGNKKT